MCSKKLEIRQICQLDVTLTLCKFLLYSKLIIVDKTIYSIHKFVPGSATTTPYSLTSCRSGFFRKFECIRHQSTNDLNFEESYLMWNLEKKLYANVYNGPV